MPPPLALTSPGQASPALLPRDPRRLRAHPSAITELGTPQPARLPGGAPRSQRDGIGRITVALTQARGGQPSRIHSTSASLLLVGHCAGRWERDRESSGLPPAASTLPDC